MPRILFTCLFVIFNTNYLTSQWSKEVDSLITTAEKMADDTLKIARYATLFEKLMFTDNNRALKYAEKEYTLANELNYQKGKGSGLLHYGTYYENIGQMDSAKAYFLRSKNAFIEMKSPKGALFINHALASFEKKMGHYDQSIALYMENIGLYNLPENQQKDLKGFNKIGAEYLGIAEIYKEKGNYKIAVAYALRALRFFEKIKHVRRTGNSLKELGDIEYRRKNYDEAIEYGLQAIAIYKDHDYHEDRGYTSINVGKSFMAKNDFKTAMVYFEEAELLGRTHKFLELEATALSHLGMVQGMAKNYVESLHYLNQGFKLHEKLASKINMVIDLNEMAKTNLALDNYDKTIVLSTQAISIAKEIGTLPNLEESYLIKSKAYDKLKRYELAFKDFKLYKRINDSIFDLTSTQQIEELRTIYETEKKEQQITLQEKEIDVLEQQAEINNLQRLLLGGGFGLSLMVAGFGFYGFRQKIKRSKLEKEKIAAELAFKKKELTTHALHLARKNETLENLKAKAEALREKEHTTSGFNQLIRAINFDLQDDNNWENFARYFEEVHKDFNSNVKTKYPDITSNELRLLALLKMNLSSKEIANILNISQEGIKKARYRLRKKLDITTEDSLQDLVLSL